MAASTKNGMRFFWWFQRILYWWVKSKATPENTVKELGFDPSKPVCYILRSRSFTDLLVLDYHCKRLGLPRPHYKSWIHKAGKYGSYIYLVKAGIVQLRSSKDAPSHLFNLVQQVGLNQQDVQIVPVSILWGRYPGREEKSLFKLMFADDENGGIFQRFFTVISHGRSVLCNFGLPISTKDLLGEGLGVEQTTRKLRRVLRVHFRSFRVATLGPHVFDRNQMIVSILKSKAVKKAIAEEAVRKKVSEAKMRKNAHRYVDEIAARLTVHAVRAFSIVLGWLWNKIYSGVQVENVERLRSCVANQEVVYMPCHRSHMDYLLIGHTLFDLGFMPPHVAAGINLNFWPAGPIIRRSGAFFIRRTFKGNRLYSVVFNEYVLYLLNKGFSLKFFPEGGRSRTGKLLAPKTGMLNMVIQGFARDPSRPVALIPVYVGYDKIMEGASYLGELGGKAKKGESVGQLFRARRILKGNFGKAYLNFGKAIDLGSLLDEVKPGWNSKSDEGEDTSKKLSGAVVDVARKVMIGINQSAIISPSSLFSLAILSSPKRAIAEDELIEFLSVLMRLQTDAPYGDDVKLPTMSVKQQLKYMESIAEIKRFSHPDGDVIHVDEREAVQLTYYRNNVLHLFAVPALIAAFFQHNDQLDRDSLKASCESLFPFLREELFIKFDDKGFDEYFEKMVEVIIASGLLISDGKNSPLKRPDVTSKEFNFLNLLGRFLGRTLERYAITSALLSRVEEDQKINREDFERNCQLMSQRIAILNGTNDPEFFDKALYKGHFELLCKLNHLKSGDDGSYRIQNKSKESANLSLGLLSIDVRHSITRVAENTQKGAK